VCFVLDEQPAVYLLRTVNLIESFEALGMPHVVLSECEVRYAGPVMRL
jgi:hypothetical protein